MKKRYLYRIIGWSAFLYLAVELATPQLPKEALPDYEKFKQEHGEMLTAVLGYFINKHASGSDTTTVVVLTFLVLVCLYVEIKINQVKGNGVKNNFFGLFQNINQTYNNGRDEE